MLRLSKCSSKTPKLCETCQAIDANKLDWVGITWIAHKSTFQALQASALSRNCPLCKLILAALTKEEWRRNILLLYRGYNWLKRNPIEIAGFGRDGNGGVNKLKIRYVSELSVRLELFADSIRSTIGILHYDLHQVPPNSKDNQGAKTSYSGQSPE
jgi:hypothetical protein